MAIILFPVSPFSDSYDTLLQTAHLRWQRCRIDMAEWNR
jgi:hypothetical protein